MNEAESHSMEQLLLARGWDGATEAISADLIIINTCSVRITAENRVLGRLGFYSALKKKKHFFVLLIGCMAERLYEDIQKTYPLIDYVVGMFERHLLPEVFEEIERKLKVENFVSATECLSYVNPLKNPDEKPKSGYHFAPFSYHEGAFQSFVPIINGCNNFCT